MTQQTCDRLMALSASLGTVPGVMRFASEVDEIARHLLEPTQLARGELCELKRCFEMAAETIGHLRQAATDRLRTLGMEQDYAG
jgi:hypothetical protein